MKKIGKFLAPNNAVLSVMELTGSNKTDYRTMRLAVQVSDDTYRYRFGHIQTLGRFDLPGTFIISCQSNPKYPGQSYGWYAGVDHLIEPDLRTLRNWTDFTNQLERKLARMEQQHGYAPNFGTYVQRIATILGITKGWIPSNWFANGAHGLHDLDLFMHKINEEIQTWYAKASASL